MHLEIAKPYSSIRVWGNYGFGVLVRLDRHYVFIAQQIGHLYIIFFEAHVVEYTVDFPILA